MVIVFDIGASKMRVAVSRDGITLGELKIVATPRRFFDGIETLKKIAADLSGGEKIDVAAGGIAGSLNKEKTEVVRVPHLLEWSRQPLKSALEEALGAPVLLENDVALSGLGEAILGAGKGCGIVAYLSVGTGMNGVRIVDGAIDRNALGFEIGHQIIECDGTQCACGGNGHLEGYVSGSALEEKYGKPALEIDNQAAWNEAARMLAIGIINSILHWSPDIVVLGGSVMEKIPLDRVRQYVAENIKIFWKIPPIERGILGDAAGLNGALQFLNRK